MKKRTTRRTTRKPARRSPAKTTKRRSAPKRATRKSPVRRKAPSASRRKRRGWPDVAPEKSFWCRDGQILRNLRELPPALKRMNRDTFVHHVNRDKNDFANWVFHVIGDRQLAERVRGLKSKTAILKAVQSRL